MLFYLEESDLNESSAVLRLSGPDANTYLQGQFSQDLRLPVGQSAYGLWLDQKGKIQADSHVLRETEGYFLVVSFSLGSEALRQRLETNLIADEVGIADVTCEWSGLLLWGGDGQARPVPAGAIELPSRRAGVGARQWLVPKGNLAAARAVLGPAVRAAGATDARRERILAGIPAVPDDLGGRDLPQEGRLDDTAVSYTKGCYLGQEVMARLKNLGQVRRALHVVRGAGTPPPGGAAFFQGEQKVGECRSVAPDGDGFVALAMLSFVNLAPESGLSLVPDGPVAVRIIRRV